MMKKETENRGVNLTAMEYFLSDAFNNYLITKNHVETKINWLLGISGIIMSVSLPWIIHQDPAINYFALMVISFSAFICFLICLISLELPDWVLRKPHRDGSIMFYNTKNVLTPEDIHQQLLAIKTKDELLKQYSINIYNVVERNIKVKNKLFKGACNILFAGLVMGFVVILVAIFI
ncbi:MAG: hypothetical protein WC916_05845 [Candidatus Woesearchaeota archaeon]